ncbi:hypothetical protein TNCV_2558891 [Trichonephila clavipes]|nr:hypothetical protein TNCV_2558891 [Trichonephila clavipes]
MWLDNDKSASILDCCVQFKRPGHRVAGSGRAGHTEHDIVNSDTIAYLLPKKN